MRSSKSSTTPNFDRINPQLCINAKLRRLHRLLNAAYQQKISPFGLRGSMLSILFIIGKNKAINQKTIADMLVLDQSTMSRDLKKLVHKGWVTVSKAKDSRHSELELTKDGYALLEQVTPIWEQLHHKVEAIFGEEQIQLIDTLIETAKENLEIIKA